jgi:hypothetical protein
MLYYGNTTESNNMSNKPFNLQDFQAGHPAYTTDGHTYTYVGLARTPTSLFAEREDEEIHRFLLNGYNIDYTIKLHMGSSPEVNWYTVPVDTLLIVNRKGQHYNRYFSSFNNNAVHYFADGKTSKTANYKEDICLASPEEVSIVGNINPSDKLLDEIIQLLEPLEYEGSYVDVVKQLIKYSESYHRILGATYITGIVEPQAAVQDDKE